MRKFNYLVFDGDVLAFIAAAAVQKNIVDAAGNYRSWADPIEGEVAVTNLINKYRRQLLPSQANRADLFFLSDPKNNWRMSLVDPLYKDNRVTAYGQVDSRPILLGYLKDYLKREYGATWLPNLEADDTISMYITSLTDADGIACVVGRDKDFKSIPGWHLQIGLTEEPFLQTLADADRWHLIQALAGDRVDGFVGCPGVGMKRATLIIDAGQKFIPQEGILTKGPNKGRKTTKWFTEPCDNPWEIVVSCYEKAGLGEVEALSSARMAHLVRAGEYNHETGEVALWQPYT